MRRLTAAAGSTLFFAVAPGVVAGAVPWWLTRWQVRGPLAHWAPLVHICPGGSFTMHIAPPLQKAPCAQSVSFAHELPHAAITHA